MQPSTVGEVRIDGRRLEVVRLQPVQPQSGSPAIVMLHEGLGSVSMWRDFPQRLADSTGCEVLAYSRVGYGKSDPITTQRNVRYMQDRKSVV